MLELIGCRHCDSPYCEGCNIYILETMLNSGKLDCLMDEHRSITIDPASLRPKGEWIDVGYKIRCSACDHGVFLGTTDPVVHKYEKENFKFCPNCGADMRGEKA